MKILNQTTFYSSVAQLVRALALQARGHKFKSCQNYHIQVQCSLANTFAFQANIVSSSLTTWSIKWRIVVIGYRRGLLILPGYLNLYRFESCIFRQKECPSLVETKVGKLQGKARPRLFAKLRKFMSAPEQELKDAQYVVQCRIYFHESGKKEEKAEFRPVPIAVVTLVKNKTAQYYFLVVQYLLCKVLAELRVSVKESAVALSDLTLVHSHHACGAQKSFDRT